MVAGVVAAVVAVELVGVVVLVAVGVVVVAGVVVAGAVGAVELMLMEYVALAVWEALSVTCNVKLEGAFDVGLPEITPELLNERPAGRLPEISVQVYGKVPPVADTAAE